MIYPGSVRTNQFLAEVGSWSTWTPTITSTAGTITSSTIQEAWYRIIGNLCDIQLKFTIVTNGTGAQTIRFTTPSGATNIRAAIVYGHDNLGRMLQAIGSSASFLVVTYDSLYPGADGRVISVRGQYRIAG